MTAKGRPAVPQFTGQLKDSTVLEGSSSVMTARYTGYPEPSVTWQKDGRTIAVNNEHYYIHTEEGKSTLFMKSSDSSDTALYQCTAVNIQGTATTKARLTVQSMRLLVLFFN